MNSDTYRTAEMRLWGHYGAAPHEHRLSLPRLGADVRVTEFGEGPPVLYLHGMPTSGATFAPLTAQLPGYRNLVLDRPGCGLSDRLEITPETARTVLESLVPDVLDALGVDRAHLVASSAGSAYAMHAAIVAPDRVDRTIHLGAPWLAAGLPLPRIDRLILGRFANRLVSRMVPNRKQQAKAMRDLGHADSMEDGRIPEVYTEWYDALMQHTDTFAELGTLLAFARKGRAYREDLEIGPTEGKAITSPTHFIWGTRDVYGGPEVAQQCAGIVPEATLEILEDAGHLPWLDAGEGVARSVSAFLAASTVGV